MACMTLRAWPRVGLADGDQDQVVEDAFGGHAHVADLGQLQAHQREENALDGLAHVEILHGRRAHDGGGVERILAVRDAGDVEHRVVVFERIEAGVIAEGAFAAQLAQLDVAFQDDLGVGGDFQIRGLALDHLDGLPAQEAGAASSHPDRAAEVESPNTWWPDRRRWPRRRPCAWSAPRRDARRAIMFGALLVGLPVHAGGAAVVDLQAVAAAIALSGIGIAREHHRQGDEAAAVLRPAVQNGKAVEREIVALNHVLARSRGHRLLGKPTPGPRAWAAS